jgi:peptidoglycan-associated lipoprotein
MTLRSIGIVIGVGALAAGCHHAIAPATAARVLPAASAGSPSPRPLPPAPAPPRAAAAPAPVSEDELFRRESIEQLNAERPLGDVFFDYDQAALSDSARAALQRDAAWLTRWPGTRISVEGHCDERGSAEYNLALGDRRVAEARAYLVSLGVSAERLQGRSLGKEAPFCRAEGESCWSQNRRDHFVITAK